MLLDRKYLILGLTEEVSKPYHYLEVLLDAFGGATILVDVGGGLVVQGVVDDVRGGFPRDHDAAVGVDVADEPVVLVAVAVDSVDGLGDERDLASVRHVENEMNVLRAVNGL